MISKFDRSPAFLPQQTDCLDESDLYQLVDDQLPDELLPTVLTHLDHCSACRARLEAAAGQKEQWQAVAQHLQPKSSEPADGQLKETLQSLKDPTRQVPCATRTGAPHDAPLEKDSRLSGRYQIIRQLGHGGMGIVYLGFDEMLRRQVAIKLIQGPLTHKQEAQERIKREAIAAAAIRSPHVVTIHHIDHIESGPYLVMEYIAGVSLEERLHSETRLSPEEIIRVGSEIAAGLQAAHARGLIHRDVKPGNVLLEDGTGKVKLTDFGLVRGLDDSWLTQDDMISGTPEYIAPEQAAGREVDRRADLYSLGCVMYVLCTGKPPFHDDTPLAILRRVQDEQPASIQVTRPDIPTALCDVIERLLKKDPDARYQNAAEVQAALQALPTTDHAHAAESPRHTKRTRRGPLLAMAATAALLVAVIALGASQANGWSNFGQLLLAANDEQPAEAPAAETDVPEEVIAKQPAAAEDVVEQEVTDPAPEVTNAAELRPAPSPPAAPIRMQIVTPEQLMQERIQAEKDSLPRDESPLLARKLLGHTGPVQDFVFTPDGKSLISCSGWPIGDRTIRMWDLETGKEVRRFDTAPVPPNPNNSGTREAPGEFYALAISPDGTKLISTSTGGAVCLWDVASGKMIGEFKGHISTVYAVEISPDGTKVLTGGRDSIARLWDLNTQEELMQLKGHTSDIRTARFSPDGSQALTTSLDQTLRLWDLNAAKPIHVMRSNNKTVTDAQFSPDGSRAVSLCAPSIDIWDLKTGKLIRQFREQGPPLTTVDWSPNGRLLITAGYGGQVRLWNPDNGQHVETMLGHRNWIWRVKFTPDGKQAVSAGGGRHGAVGGVQVGPDCAIRVWDLPKLPPRVTTP